MNRAHNRRVLFSSERQDWGTPGYLFRWLDDQWHFTLDAAASDDNHLVDRYFTEATDGLAQDWRNPDGSIGRVFVNPPYGKDEHGASLQEPWFHKAVAEARSGRSWVVMLVPARTDTAWWHDVVATQASEVWLLRGRHRFVDMLTGKPAQGPSGFPLAVVMFATGGPPRFRFVDVPQEYLPRKRRTSCARELLPS